MAKLGAVQEQLDQQQQVGCAWQGGDGGTEGAAPAACGWHGVVLMGADAACRATIPSCSSSLCPTAQACSKAQQANADLADANSKITQLKRSLVSRRRGGCGHVALGWVPLLGVCGMSQRVTATQIESSCWGRSRGQPCAPHTAHHTIPTAVQADCVDEADAIAAVAEQWAAEIKDAQQVGHRSAGHCSAAPAGVDGSSCSAHSCRLPLQAYELAQASTWMAGVAARHGLSRCGGV